MSQSEILTKLVQSEKANSLIDVPLVITTVCKLPLGMAGKTNAGQLKVIKPVQPLNADVLTLVKVSGSVKCLI